MSWSTSFTDTGESDKCDPADGMEEDSIDDVLKQLFDVINMSMNDLLRIVDKKYRILWNAIKSKNLIFPRWLESLIFWPFTIMYALYVRLPLLLLGHVSRHLILFVQVACRRSRLISRLLLHVAALCKIASMIVEKVATTTFSELIMSILQTVLEFFRIWSAPRNSPKKARSITHLVELLEYQELCEDESDDDMPEHAMRRSLPRNHRLATKPFKACVRLSNGNMPNENKGFSWGMQSFMHVDDCAPNYPDSPSSFPCSPDSRARHMSCSEVEADSVVFYVRDKLRLETQSASTDAVSRQAASRVLKEGNNIAFDPNFALPDIFLACGNHYVLKTSSDGSCSTSRASVAVWPGVYMYLEFSITSQSEHNPSSFVSGPVDLSIGLIPADCPPNVTAGQWPNSVGMSSVGKFLVAGKDFDYNRLDGKEEMDTTLPVQISASTTIGILVYIPKRNHKQSDKEFRRSKLSSPQRARPNSCVLDRSDHDGSDQRDYDDIDTLGVEENSFDTTVTDQWEPAIQLLDTISSPSTHSKRKESEYARNNNQISITYNINGKVVAMNEGTKAAVSHELGTKREGGSSIPPLYPVVSLMSKNTGSWCRFCESDVVYRKRREIGAPEGERVYCLDGSLLLDSN